MGMHWTNVQRDGMTHGLIRRGRTIQVGFFFLSFSSFLVLRFFFDAHVFLSLSSLFSSLSSLLSSSSSSSSSFSYNTQATRWMEKEMEC